MIFNEMCWCRKQVRATKSDADLDGVVVPTTLQEYVAMTAKPRPPEHAVDIDFYDDDYLDNDEDDDVGSNAVYDETEGDSGHGDT